MSKDFIVPIQLTAQNDPAAPAAGKLLVYAKDIAGRIFPKWIGPAGVDTPVQQHIAFNGLATVAPAGGTTGTTVQTAVGTQYTNAATTFNNPTPASTNLGTSIRRTTFATNATAGQITYHRQNTLMCWRGNATGLGGFFFNFRFKLETLASANRGFFGLSDSIANPTNVDPTTSTTPGKIGLAFNANTGNWRFVNNVTGSAPTSVDLGPSFPLNTNDAYELILYSAPNGSSIGYRITNMSTNVQTSGSIGLNIPSNTTFLAPVAWMTNNATAAIVSFAIYKWTLESDY